LPSWPRRCWPLNTPGEWLLYKTVQGLVISYKWN